LSLMAIFSFAFAARAEDARKIPGINVEDKFKNGCVDCHIKDQGGVDTRISVQFNKWKDGNVEPKLLLKAQAAAPDGVTLKAKHPGVISSLQDIPAKCVTCHEKMSKSSPQFGQMIHLVHLSDGDQNKFMTTFQGECTYCHKIDMKKGAWSHPSGPEKE
jgi:hypothetical protein